MAKLKNFQDESNTFPNLVQKKPANLQIQLNAITFQIKFLNINLKNVQMLHFVPNQLFTIK